MKSLGRVATIIIATLGIATGAIGWQWNHEYRIGANEQGVKKVLCLECLQKCEDWCKANQIPLDDCQCDCDKECG